jgi:hypothetical protein
MPTTTLPAVHDHVSAPAGTARVEYVTADAYLVNGYGDRWTVPVDQLVLVRPAVRGGAPAEWAVSAAWTA